MNYHILLDCCKNNRYTLSSLILFVLLATTFTVSNSFAQEDQTITLTTNKNSYQPGDVVILNGTITNQPGQLVAIQIKDSTGNLILIRTIQTDQNGNFAIQFKIPTTATSGNFDIMASARINGFVVTQTKTMTATVPEFGQTASVVISISIIGIVVISRAKFPIFKS